MEGREGDKAGSLNKAADEESGVDPVEAPERWNAARKTETVFRLLKGEEVGAVSRQVHVPVEVLKDWQRLFVESGSAALKSRVEAVRETFLKIGEFARQGDAERFREGLWNSAEMIRSYLLSFRVEGTGEDFTAPYVNDALVRFLRTLEFVPFPPPRRILEIGSNPYFFHLLLHGFFAGSDIEGANFFDHDVFSTRQGSITQKTASQDFQENHEFHSELFNLETVAEYPYPPDTFDLVFLCETLEHLNVDPLSVFGKLRRILRPGGHLIVTLPNAARLTNLALMLEGYNVFDLYHGDNGIYGRHNREFTLDELKAILRGNGFLVVRAETHDRCNYDVSDIITADYTGTAIHLKWRRTDLVNALEVLEGRLSDRGDNLYLLAQKPRE